MPINTGSMPELLRPGLNKLFGDTYGGFKEEHLYLFDKAKSERSYEEDVQLTGLGYAPVKSEGASIDYDDIAQGFKHRYQMATVALAVSMTEEVIEDNLYESVATRVTRALARSASATINTYAANIYNRGFNSAYTYGDGKEFFATDHPTPAGVYANETAAAAFSQAALEDLGVLIDQAKDYRGIPFPLRSKCLIVPAALRFQASRILESHLESSSADNAINVVKSTGMFPDGYEVNHYLTSATSYFIKTDLMDAVRFFDRLPAEYSSDNDFDTGNEKLKMRMRFAFGVTDAKGAFANVGA